MQITCLCIFLHLLVQVVPTSAAFIFIFAMRLINNNAQLVSCCGIEVAIGYGNSNHACILRVLYDISDCISRLNNTG